MKVCDLHTHSYYSDGRENVKTLVYQASRKKIKFLALTDHNSMDGVEEAIREGKKYRIEIIPAIELRAEEDEILGYFVDKKNKKFNKELNKIRKRVQEKIKKWCKQLEKKGFDISYKEIQRLFPQAASNINEFYPYYTLILKGYGKKFSEIRKQFREAGIKRRRIKEIPITKAIRLVISAGGVPVLAHPWVEQSSRNLLIEKNFIKLVKAGLQGIELDNGDRDERRSRKIVKKIKYLAKKYNLIMTSGSDYHGRGIGAISKTHELGKYNCDEKIIEELKARRLLK